MHDHTLSMYHIMELWWGIFHDNLYLSIHSNLVMQGLSLGWGDTENCIFLVLLCGKSYFLWINFITWS